MKWKTSKPMPTEQTEEIVAVGNAIDIIESLLMVDGRLSTSLSTDGSFLLSRTYVRLDQRLRCILFGPQMVFNNFDKFKFGG